MSLERLVSKYIASAQQVLDKMQQTKTPTGIDAEAVRKVVDHAKAYLKDSEYYKDKRKLHTSLASVAYCEGLLDALRLLGALEFEWPTKEKRRRVR
ncbi:DUF357 domain-containing protein [Candidatus Bathyarchaeota archaeon]|nr:DUF357 domain-containing protein [Candidatus Bathyarchaeota archaeon]